ncbi:hypothetical protein RCG17_03215 [Neobacillus sp. PS3-12]|uniref:hypothetical protein n=1 Tax=Neobacillus sp. PS3-12 TaxID=3070677 RepID=UPI0027DFA368|nr:hypothetical protein [Neobacillus sp. PS3-12]WML53702.1 hypothetical protein RCG17_03215 [Neobacillus sp. PS3-12]
MPRGKELEQLPAGNVAPGAGKDQGRYHRKILESIEQNEQPQPSEISKENEDMI